MLVFVSGLLGVLIGAALTTLWWALAVLSRSFAPPSPDQFGALVALCGVVCPAAALAACLRWDYGPSVPRPRPPPPAPRLPTQAP